MTLLLAISASIYANAHDVILKCDGERIEALVIEVGSTSVKYKRMDNPNGPVYVCDIRDIQSITYENGRVETYGEAPREEPKYYVNYYDVRYNDIKGWYNTRDYESYEGEPFSPILSGLSSWLIPGLGQCFDGEWGRGIGIMAANVGFAAAELTGLTLMVYYAQPLKYYNESYDYSTGYSYDYVIPDYTISTYDGVRAALCLGGTLLTAAFHAAFNIWNICDAVKIAKVKNLYYQDAGKNASLNMRFEPELALYPSAGYSLSPAAGFKLSVSF